MKYLKDTIDNGIYFWRQIPRKDRPLGHLPTCVQSNNYEPKIREQLIPVNSRATVDSDYSNDVSHRKSATGITIKIGEAYIYYKTRFQTTVTPSSTEAEFTAVCEAAKVILYVRYILDDISVA